MFQGNEKIAREFATPMLAILGYASILQHELRDPEQARQAREIGALAKNVLRQLGSAHEDAGEMKLAQRTFTAGALTSEVHLRLAGAAEHHRLWFEVHADPQLAALEVVGDELRLRQVLLTLCAHAIRCTPEGGVALRSRLLAVEAGCVRLRFDLNDTGSGATHDRDLSLSRRLIDLMGGEFGFETDARQGSHCWIEVTLRRPPTANRGAASLAAQPESGAIVPVVTEPKAPVIDRQIGLKYAAGRPELYDRVLVRFRELHSADGDALARALASRDRRTAQRLLHSLKGVAAMIGALGLRDEAARLEGRYIAGATEDDIAHDLLGIESSLGAVTAAIDVLRMELQQEERERAARHH